GDSGGDGISRTASSVGSMKRSTTMARMRPTFAATLLARKAGEDAMDVGALKRRVCEAVDAMESELLRLSRAIHAKPELAFEEHAAHSLLVDAVRKAGLEVEAGAYGLETAFASEFGPRGACVAVLAEYDALPEIGHGCGHNLIAAAGVGAGLAL